MSDKTTKAESEPEAPKAKDKETIAERDERLRRERLERRVEADQKATAKAEKNAADEA